MRKYMLMLSLAAAILLTQLGINAAHAQPSRPLGWTPWSCYWSVSGYPVTGGTMSGRGCATWRDDNVLQWEVWADTCVPSSYHIQTAVTGEDRCSGGQWVYEMFSVGDVYNTTYGTSNPAAGSYLDCYGGHSYWNANPHFRQQYSSSNWEGTGANSYW